ncbi:hypothetical protein GIB67_015658 [Kingdonia uniflora]|uniref:Argonaute linker 2 domain-containing protein n=1 Tax=Kingdonia uniflora TaxID=39325 RepID=A0A7J7NU36_9MAGN|nr:hypothetical protein GIB67_015658 [Kingdonia uniflora]
MAEGRAVFKLLEVDNKIKKTLRVSQSTKVVPSSRLYSTSKRPTILCFNTLIGLVCKQEISNGQIIFPWRTAEGQSYSKSLSEKKVTSLLKVTCQRPYDSEHDIVKAVHHNDYDEDPYAKEFELKIRNKLATIEARILPTPVSYNKGLLLEGYYYPCSFILKNAFRKIHVRLTMELEKKFSGKVSYSILAFVCTLLI